MSYNYSLLVKEANTQRQRLGLPSLFENVMPSKNRFLTPGIKKQLENKIDELYRIYTDIQVTPGLDQHMRLLPWVLKEIDDKAELTMGSIRKKKQRMFEFNFHEIKSWYEEGVDLIERLDPNFHVWITLSSMEIIDMTLPVQIHYTINRSIEPVPFNAGKPEKMFYDTSYHPFVLGNDLVSQIFKNSLLKR